MRPTLARASASSTRAMSSDATRSSVVPSRRDFRPTFGRSSSFIAATLSSWAFTPHTSVTPTICRPLLMGVYPATSPVRWLTSASAGSMAQVLRSCHRLSLPLGTPSSSRRSSSENCSVAFLSPARRLRNGRPDLWSARS